MKLVCKQPILRNLVMCIALLLTSLYVNAQVDSVTASIDKNPAMTDESIVLSVVAIGDADANDFDPSVLAGDFVVGRTSTSTQTRMINFDTTRSTTWTTVLIPRKQGNFTIPALQIGGKATQPITVRVIPPTTTSTGQARDAFVTTDVDIEQPYVQQQITYTIKIHLAVELQRGSLANPEVASAEIKKLGDDKRYSDIVDGQRYTIIERKYAIIPQTSGEISIKGPLFEAEIIDRSRNSFSYFNQTRPINRVSPDIVLDVQPIPASFDDQWLPSEFVQLNEEWQPGLDEIKVGEPITRTLTLSALGVAKEQLPEIEGVYPPGFKVYPDQPTTASVVREGRLIAQRVENIALIPNRAGQFVLPPIKVAWFNTITKQVEHAQLPGRSVEVAAATNAQSTQPSPTAAVPETNEPSSIETTPVLAPTIQTVEVARFWSASSWILLVLWLITLLAWIWHSRNQQKTQPALSPSDSEEKELWGELKRRVKTDQPGDIFAAIQKWKSALSIAAGSSVNVEKQWLLQQSLQNQIDTMLASKYAQSDNKWRSDTLLTELTTFRSSVLSKQRDSAGLQPLYHDA